MLVIRNASQAPPAGPLIQVAGEATRMSGAPRVPAQASGTAPARLGLIHLACANRFHPLP
jgi:hypothetical protein